MQERVPAESFTGGGEGPALLGSGGTRRLTDVKEGCRRGGVPAPKGSTTRASGHQSGPGMDECRSALAAPFYLSCPAHPFSSPRPSPIAILTFVRLCPHRARVV